jgi:hypothetical protein
MDGMDANGWIAVCGAVPLIGLVMWDLTPWLVGRVGWILAPVALLLAGQGFALAEADRIDFLGLAGLIAPAVQFPLLHRIFVWRVGRAVEVTDGDPRNAGPEGTFKMWFSLSALLLPVVVAITLDGGA